MTSSKTQSPAKSAKPRKIQTGDMIAFGDTAKTFRVHLHPWDAHKLMLDLKNPKLVISNPDQGQGLDPNTSDEIYIVIEHRDIFDTFGYKHRYCKIAGIKNAVSGWITAESLKVVAEGSDCATIGTESVANTEPVDKK